MREQRRTRWGSQACAKVLHRRLLGRRICVFPANQPAGAAAGHSLPASRSPIAAERTYSRAFLTASMSMRRALAMRQKYAEPALLGPSSCTESEPGVTVPAALVI